MSRYQENDLPKAKLDSNSLQKALRILNMEKITNGNFFWA
jgi:hypothetical protein